MTSLGLPFRGGSARTARSSRWRSGQRIRFRPPVALALILGALVSAAVLIIAEFLTLYVVRVVHGTSTVPPVAAGTENHYALIPIAVLAVVLTLAAIRLRDRWALVAVAVLGLIALLIGLLHDLPDARRTGLVGSLHTGWVRGASSPGAAMYMETLGAVLLLLTAGVGLLFGETIDGESPQEQRQADPADPVPPAQRTSGARAPGTPAKGASAGPQQRAGPNRSEG